MEGIFNKPTQEDEIKALQGKGKTIRQIAEQLNISKSKVGRVSSGTLSQDVPHSVPTPVPDCPTLSQENPVLSHNPVPSVPNDIISRIEKLEQTAPQGDNDYVTSKEIHLILEEFKEKIQTILEERIQKTLNYYVNKHLEEKILEMVKQSKEATQGGLTN